MIRAANPQGWNSPNDGAPRLIAANFFRNLGLSRFDAAPLIALTATKETDYGTETDG
ncbi:hypothetical protein [Pseudooceanicola sp.]|uniref:hypothetical protein n=1 Tax=Pseudooceanicola sp. TaxID=1914328 RepID=UPI002610801C|nr:hypothetical protein [Pseudooceanicola sp.]